MMSRCPAVIALAVAALPAVGLAQITYSTHERSYSTAVALGNGVDDFGSADSDSASPFVGTVNRGVAEPNGGGAEGTAGQNSTTSSSSIIGSLSAFGAVRTGSSFVTGEATSQSNFLVLFSLAAPTPVLFTGNGSVALTGVNPNGEPSDLYGRARLQLVNADTLDPVAGFNIFPEAGVDSVNFNGVLPAGNYALSAQAFSYAFSADLLGPPARSGSGQSDVNFSLTVVPAPSAMALLGLAGVFAGRRRR
jgi:hypothetical protein